MEDVENAILSSSEKEQSSNENIEETEEFEEYVKIAKTKDNNRLPAEPVYQIRPRLYEKYNITYLVYLN